MSDDPRVRELLADHVLGLLGRDEAERVERALAASGELRAEADGLRAALLALPEALEPVTPGPEAWRALADRLRQDAAVPGADAAQRRSAPPPAQRRSAPPRAVPALALALAVSVALLAGTAGWGAIQYGRAAQSGREEAIVAYWMRAPDLQITPLEPVGDSHAGVVCVLPDGRAMVLQPHAPTAGADYVLYGNTEAGRMELGRTRGRLIEFRADGVQAVELTLAGPAGGPIGHAALR